MFAARVDSDCGEEVPIWALVVLNEPSAQGVGASVETLLRFRPPHPLLLLGSFGNSSALAKERRGHHAES